MIYALSSPETHELLPNKDSFHLNVSAFQSKAETSLLVFHEVERHLRVALFLKVGNDRLTHQFGVSHHVEHLKEQQ